VRKRPAGIVIIDPEKSKGQGLDPDLDQDARREA